MAGLIDKLFYRFFSWLIGKNQDFTSIWIKLNIINYFHQLKFDLSNHVILILQCLQFLNVILKIFFKGYQYYFNYIFFINFKH